MIKGFVARAMQISLLQELELNLLHSCELKHGYLLPNENIQELLHLPTIKEKYGIPKDNDEAQREHQERIEKELKTNKLIYPREKYDSLLEWQHAMDWGILKNKSKIIWEFFGGFRGRKSILSEIDK